MEINQKIATTWSKVGSRATFGLVMAEVGKHIADLMVLTADTSTSAGLDRFKKAFPNKFVDVGIAEQNMMAIAAGLASEGVKVVTATFAPFQTLRCCEQIRVNLGYMKQNVVMVGLASGVVLGQLGYTHCCVEDLAVMRAIPGMTVLSPADCTETAKAVQAALEQKSPVYIRLTGGADNPVVYDKDYEFQIGKGITLREGADVAIIATGTMVHRALGTAALLEADGLAASVIDMHTIAPVDEELLNRVAPHCRLIVTMEEHSIRGGLGSAVAEHVVSIAGAAPMLMIGLPHAFGHTGDYAEILELAGLTAGAMAEKIRNRLKISRN